MASIDRSDERCSIARSLEVIGQKWSLLIVREAFRGRTRFADIRTRLGVAPDVLTERLNTLVDSGVLTREPYQEPGSRTRYAYQLTEAGRELQVVLGALQQWGDAHLPWPEGPTVLRRARKTGRPLHLGFVDDRGREVPLEDVEWVRTAAYPA